MSFWNPIDNPFMGAGIVLLALSYREAANAGTGLQGFATNAGLYIGVPFAVGAGVVALGYGAYIGAKKIKERIENNKIEKVRKEQQEKRIEKERDTQEKYKVFASVLNNTAENQNVPEKDRMNTEEIRENFTKYNSYQNFAKEFFNPEYCYSKSLNQQAIKDSHDYNENVPRVLTYPVEMFKQIEYKEDKNNLYMKLETQEYVVKNVDKVEFKEGQVTFSSVLSQFRKVNPEDYREKDLTHNEVVAMYRDFKNHADSVLERFTRLKKKEAELTPLSNEQTKTQNLTKGKEI